jgi:hypothetical protein
MISWDDGIEYLPDGTPMREIAQRNNWMSSAWICPGGEAFRRYVDRISDNITYESIPGCLDSTLNNRVGIHVGSWMSYETAIATAWLYREPESRAHVRVLDPAEPILPNLAWGDPEINPEAGDFSNEKWKNLIWKIGPVICDARYKISNHNRLKSPTGEITRGHAALGTRWAAVKGQGLVDLQQAYSLKPKKTVPPRVHRAIVALFDGKTVKQHAISQRISHLSAWQYYNLAIALIQDRSVGEMHVSPDLWRLLQDLCGESVLCGKLTELHKFVKKELRRDISFEELRFARACHMVF